MTRSSPCGWIPDLTGCRSGPCCPDTSAPESAAIVALAEDLASNILWRLTGMRYGLCPITVRPCKPKTCDPLTLTDIIYWDQRYLWNNGNLGVFSFTPLLIDGQIYNISCGCPTGCCKCESTCEVWLPGPVDSITEVINGGVIVPSSAYTLYGNRLVFLNGANCPSCQDYSKDAGQVGTWTVEYVIGEPVPDLLAFAAGLYACELAKSLLGESCALPSRVQNVTRQGMTVSFVDPMILSENGLTGIPLVDQIITAINPSKLKSASYVWSPNTHARVRRER